MCQHQNWPFGQYKSDSANLFLVSRIKKILKLLEYVYLMPFFGLNIQKKPKITIYQQFQEFFGLKVPVNFKLQKIQ